MVEVQAFAGLREKQYWRLTLRKKGKEEKGEQGGGEREEGDEKEGKDHTWSPGPVLSPPPSWQSEGSRDQGLESLETNNVHVKHIILLQSGKDLANKVVCLKTIFPKLFQDKSERANIF